MCSFLWKRNIEITKNNTTFRSQDLNTKKLKLNINLTQENHLDIKDNEKVNLLVQGALLHGSILCIQLPTLLSKGMLSGFGRYK